MDDEVGLNELFYAHLNLTQFLTLGDCKRFLGKEFTDFVSATWIERIKFKAVLKNPAYTVPLIEVACRSEYEPAKKLSRVLLAVSNAVSVRLSEDSIKWLEEFSMNRY